MIFLTMRYFSTRNKNEKYSFRDAALKGLAPDGGLFVPEEIPKYPESVITSEYIKEFDVLSFHDIAFETIKPYVKDDIPDSALKDIIISAFSFDAPLIEAGGTDRFVLELFHGPTAAFKDFGARFMARAFSYLRRGEDKPLHILVATSGDTGGAVADGFFGVEGISVTVLYPKGRVSPLQERQIAGLGKNISAIAVEGSFDDCQRLAKAALADEDLNKRKSFSSANSINIARLIPQIVYYSSAASQNISLTRSHISAYLPLVLCVPSGNFGNLTAGLYAKEMGAPIEGFIAATNINKTIPDYLENGIYETRQTQATLSNAMDVGAPSNFERMASHFSYDKMKEMIKGVFVTDTETLQTIKQVYEETGYFLDPHTAVGWKGVDKLKEKKLYEWFAGYGVLSTAHPAKFAEIVEPLVGMPPMPESLARAMERTVNAITIPADVDALIDLLGARC